MDIFEMIKLDSKEYKSNLKINISDYCELKAEIAASKNYSEDSHEREGFKNQYIELLEETIKEKLSTE